jgi:hypothetical protein
LDEICGLAHRDENQEGPQPVAVFQLWKASLLDATAEAVEGAEGHVLFVGEAPQCASQTLACQSYQPRVVALQQRLGRLVVAGLRVLNQRGHGPRRRHRLSPAFSTEFAEKKR